MSFITAITPQIKDKDRCNIFVDNVFYCGMELETVIKNKLKAGQAIDKDSLALLQLESEKSVALDKAMGFISNSIKTAKNVREYLIKKGYTDVVADYAVNKLSEYKYIDDKEYARAYVANYSKVKGAKLIRLELRAKGISDEDMAEALESIADEKEAARAVADKYLRNKERDFKNIQKAYKYLLSKGFSYETAKDAVRGEDCEDY